MCWWATYRESKRNENILSDPLTLEPAVVHTCILTGVLFSITRNKIPEKMTFSYEMTSISGEFNLLWLKIGPEAVVSYHFSAIEKSESNFAYETVNILWKWFELRLLARKMELRQLTKFEIGPSKRIFELLLCFSDRKAFYVLNCCKLTNYSKLEWHFFEYFTFSFLRFLMSFLKHTLINHRKIRGKYIWWDS